VQYLSTLMQSSHDEAKQKKFGLTPKNWRLIPPLSLVIPIGRSENTVCEFRPQLQKNVALT
jgi:hypothetical protein